MTRWLVRFVGLMLVASAAFAQQAIPTPAEYLGYRLGERFGHLRSHPGLFRRADETFAAHHVAELRPDIRGPSTRTGGHHVGEEPRCPRRHPPYAALAEPDNIDVTRANEIEAHDARHRGSRLGVHGNESLGGSSHARGEHAAAREQSGGAGQSHRDHRSAAESRRPRVERAVVRADARRRGERQSGRSSSTTSRGPAGASTTTFILMNRDWTWMSQQIQGARWSTGAGGRRWWTTFTRWVTSRATSSRRRLSPEREPAARPRQVAGDVRRAIAEAFSNRGWQFFVGERYDLLLSRLWRRVAGVFNGAIGMTYEMAGGGRAGRGHRAGGKRPHSRRTHRAAFHVGHGHSAHGLRQSRGTSSLHLRRDAREPRGRANHA